VLSGVRRQVEVPLHCGFQKFFGIEVRLPKDRDSAIPVLMDALLMIFTDVLLLIVSIRYYDRYEYLFRNSGFVISTVLLRISLSTEKPFDLIISVVAILYGLALISIFAWHTRLFADGSTQSPGGQPPATTASEARSGCVYFGRLNDGPFT
jgi:hypothetical protein